EMRFDAGKYVSGAWSALTQVVADIAGQDRRPAPRYGHTMVWDPHVHYNARAGKDGHVGFLFGGQLWTTAYSDTLWALWLFYDGTVGWQPRLFGGPRPSARARYSMVLDPNQGFALPLTYGARLYLFGGDSVSVTAER